MDISISTASLRIAVASGRCNSVSTRGQPDVRSVGLFVALKTPVKTVLVIGAVVGD